jgi:outer membrane protein OmpA-like peptidoglycan-associated protein
MSVAKVLNRRVIFALALALLLIATTSALAQDQSKIDIFGGYSWESPGRIGAPVVIGGVPTIVPGGPTLKLNGQSGFGSSVTFNLTKFFGLTGDFAGHFNSSQANTTSITGGPKLFFRTEHMTPFAEALFGLGRVAPAHFNAVNGLQITVGGGLDMDITKHFAWRVLQADWVRQQFSTSGGLGVGHMNGARLQGGVVFKFCTGTAPAPTASCSAAQPSAVMAGEPVNVSINPAGFNPKHTLTYDWKTTGGKVTGKETTATIDTTGLAPGTYTVNGTATDPKTKKNNVASCSSTFTVNEPPKHPPVMSCSASPATVRSGDAATVTAQASSPDNRPLTYTWTATGGRVTGTGETVTLDTAGAPAGPITVNGVVTDDRGLTANCTATVSVEVPPPPPQASKLNEITFPNEKKPWRVDNTAKAILDDVALRLQREPDAKAVIVGYMDPSEEKLVKKLKLKDLPALRAVDTKYYLTAEKGIDPSRIETRTGTAAGNRAEIYIVPAGATFNVPDTTPVDENVVKPILDHPVVKKAAHKKAAAKQ